MILIFLLIPFEIARVPVEGKNIHTTLFGRDGLNGSRAHDGVNWKFQAESVAGLKLIAAFCIFANEAEVP